MDLKINIAGLLKKLILKAFFVTAVLISHDITAT